MIGSIVAVIFIVVGLVYFYRRRLFVFHDSSKVRDYYSSYAEYSSAKPRE